jgi:mannosylglycoprotein endo-beta-mannosidase
VHTVAEILQIFGQVSGLVVNRSKCAVYPIRCEEVDITEIMQSFHCPIKSFPCTYLGLPLRHRALHRVEIQPLVDKVANRLASWKGKFLNKAGRLKLLNTVLSSIPTYFLTVFVAKKWAIRKLDKIRRGFLWRGAEEAKGGHCLVQWAKVQKPKKLGGLGVLDLEFFGRSLRLRWLWYQWKEPDRPWVGSDVPCNETDRQFFRLSTIVIVGNGQQARFWDSSWLNGQASKDLAPDLYKLAWRKNQSVKDDLRNCNWTRGIWRMTTANEMAQLVSLWERISDVQLTDEVDEIKWRWTGHGQYSARSAYLAQFAGFYCTFDAEAIWKAKTEGKHRIFAWQLVQRRILTADLLIIRNWPCDPICKLCDQEPETAEHICLKCVYAQEVWLLVQVWTEGLVHIPERGVPMEDWWNSTMLSTTKQIKTQRASISIYTAWNLWKERNRRIFERVSAPPSRILQLIKEEMATRAAACDILEPPYVS